MKAFKLDFNKGQVFKTELQERVIKKDPPHLKDLIMSVDIAL